MPKIEIIQPKESWLTDFIEIEKRLTELLNSNTIRIDHIGSTSITGLAAKDVIDIQISVADLSEPEVKDTLIRAGYNHSSDVLYDNLIGYDHDSPELKKHFFREQKGQRRTHIHIREMGRVNQRYAILFRDFLRVDELTRQAYGKIKIELANHFPDDADAYYAIKDPYMDTIFRAATLWASDVGWSLPR